MSLEKAMDDLRASIDSLNKTLGNMKGESSGGGESETGRKARGRPRNPPEGEGGRAETKSDDKASPDKIRKAFGEYLGVDDDDEYQKRREFVEAILNELGVDKISNATDDDMRKAYAWLQQKLDGKRVRFDGADDRKRDLV